MKKLTKKSIIAILCVLLIGLIIWTVWGNTDLEVNEYEITSNRIPEVFSGFRIAQVSDLHNIRRDDISFDWHFRIGSFSANQMVDRYTI